MTAPITGRLLPIFQVGDFVRFECQVDNTTPRWNFNHDNGGGGVWMYGTVTYARGSVIVVEPQRGPVWHWPLPCNRSFPSNSPHLDGWLELVE